MPTHKSLPHDLASRLGPDSIFAQLAAHGLLPALGGAVIDLSNSSEPVRTAGTPPRLVNGRRSKFPVLMAWPSANGRTVSAWCPHCCRYHTHGRGDGHRVAHCAGDSSPFKDTGYVIREVRP
jgi:hypothetical protein